MHILPSINRNSAGGKKQYQDHFNTEHLLANLTHRTVSSGFISLGTQGAKLALNLASTIILARLLMPKDFGLVTMVMAVSGLLMVLKDAGLSTATIQKDSITHAQVSNLFWVNIAFSSVLALIMAATAPVVAWFYKEPRLTNIALSLGVIFLLNGSTYQHLSLLKRQMRFKKIAVIELGSAIAGLSLAIFMAFLGYGYWSLVGQQMLLALVALLLTWSLSSWRPGLFTRNCGTKRLLHFGMNLTGAGFMQSFSRMIEFSLIGRFYGADILGLYSRGNALLMNPLQRFISPLSNVFLPVLSRLQGDPQRYRRGFFQLFETIALIMFPLAGLLMALSQPFTHVVLGPNWKDVAPIVACFTIFIIYVPSAHASTWLFMSQGRGKEVFKYSTISSFLAIASILAGLPFGIFGVALSYSGSGLFIRLPLLFYFAGRHGPVSTRDLRMIFIRHIPIFVFVFITTYATYLGVKRYDALTQLFISVPVGLTVGAGLILGSKHKRQIVVNALRVIKKTLKRDK